MASSRKADFNLNSIGKAATDSRYINYKALQYAIIYGKKPNLGFLQDREIAEKRIAELDKIYARGEKPPLAQKFSSPTKKSRKNRESYDTQNVKVENIKTGEVLNFKNIYRACKYLAPIIDRSIPTIFRKIRMQEDYLGYRFELEKKHKIRAENIKTGEVLDFENINQLSKYLGERCGNELRADKIKEKIEYEKLYKKEWRFSYIEEGD